MHDFISIVDDDPSVCRAVGALVRSLGYPVRTFDSAKAFLESEAPRASACVISDVRMPGMSGLDMQRYLVAAGLAVPLIFIGGDPDPRIVRAVLAAGAFAFHAKPFDLERLAQSIQQALDDDAG